MILPLWHGIKKGMLFDEKGMMNQFNPNKYEVFGYPIMLLLLMWTSYLADYELGLDLYEWGVKPRDWNGLRGVLFMPLIHSQNDFNHILNNSAPVFVLLASLVYFYRKIAFKVFALVWIFTGLFTWLVARDSYHIGMSGVIYGLVGFLFMSGALRNYRPLMGVSLFVVFLYGSLIWGIFPMQAHVSWEGHLFGLGTGIILSFLFRKQGPQSPKYQYEVEQEMGIESEDLEAKWRELNAEHLPRHEQKAPAIQVHYEFVHKKKDQKGDATDGSK